jgi:putative two-component system response regulator
MNDKNQPMNTSEEETETFFVERLNGLFNQGSFQLTLDRKIKSFKRRGEPYSLDLEEISNIDRFKISPKIKSPTKSRIQDKRPSYLENVLFVLAGAVEVLDQYTQGHNIRVATMAMTLGEELGLEETEIEALRIGGMLHDIGKIGIPENILNKPSSLNSQEWELMKSHSVLGHKICGILEKKLDLALDSIRYHHEKLDQSGYPEGLPGPRISKVARIMAVVDIFDAMTSNRPYRAALSPGEAFKYLREEADCQKLDREIVEYFIQIFRSPDLLNKGEMK